MYPDAGAAKKYKADSTCIIGNKHRNGEGRIDSYELLNFVEGTKSVCIVDDICSYGGTFVAVAKALRERGVETIGLIVSHCEDNILKGEVFNYVDFVYTSDSICHIENHEKIEFIDSYDFRNVKEEVKE
jgi:ribose-phosphate pyrophosphokinase